MAPLTRKRAAAIQRGEVDQNTNSEQVSRKKRARTTSPNKPKKARSHPLGPIIDADEKVREFYDGYVEKALASAGYLDETRFLPVYVDVREAEYANSLLRGRVDGQFEWSHEEWKEKLDEFYERFMAEFGKKRRDDIIADIEKMRSNFEEIPEDERTPAFPYIVDGLTLEGATTMYSILGAGPGFLLAEVLDFVQEQGENYEFMGGKTTEELCEDYAIEIDEDLVTIAGELLWSMDNLKPNMTMQEMEKMGSAFICLCCCPAVTKEKRRTWPELVVHFYRERGWPLFRRSHGGTVNFHTVTEANEGRPVKISPDPDPANDGEDED